MIGPKPNNRYGGGQVRVTQGMLLDVENRFVASRRLTSSLRFSSVALTGIKAWLIRLLTTKPTDQKLPPRRASVRSIHFGITARTDAIPTSARAPLPLPKISGVWLYAVLTVFVLTAIAAIGNAAMQRDRKSIMLDDSGLRAQITTKVSTVAELLDQYGVTLNQSDEVYPPLTAELSDGQSVRVLRANRYTLAVDGRVRDVLMIGGTVGDLLAKAGVSVGPDDEVTPPLSARLSLSVNVQVSRISRVIEESIETLPFSTTYRKDDSLAKGKERVSNEGSEGVKLVRTEVVLRDGEEIAREVVSEQITQVPQNRVVMQGTRTATPKPKATPSPKPKPTATPRPKNATVNDSKNTIEIGGKTYSIAETYTMEVTAYTHTGRTTASGVWPKAGAIAVDRSLIPFGTKLYVPGYGIGEACDVGGFSGYQIDIFMDTERECINWGRKRDVSVYILK